MLKDIKFPVMLDMFDMCSKDLQEKLRPARTEFKAYEDWLVDQATRVKGKNRTEAEKAEREAQDNAEHEPWCFGDDEGSNNSGYRTCPSMRRCRTVIYSFPTGNR